MATSKWSNVQDWKQLQNQNQNQQNLFQGLQGSASIVLRTAKITKFTKTAKFTVIDHTTYKIIKIYSNGCRKAHGKLRRLRNLRKLRNLPKLARPLTKSTEFILKVVGKAHGELRKLKKLRNLRKLRNLLKFASLLKKKIIKRVAGKAHPKLRKLLKLQNLLTLRFLR